MQRGWQTGVILCQYVKVRERKRTRKTLVTDRQVRDERDRIKPVINHYVKLGWRKG